MKPAGGVYAFVPQINERIIQYNIYLATAYVFTYIGHIRNVHISARSIYNGSNIITRDDVPRTVSSVTVRIEPREFFAIHKYVPLSDTCADIILQIFQF